ncbi:MAG: GGDEF domain-containing protein [Candidatus Magnetoovum sp. WYHC-5]|nr:GGDEF domain-containing protein [Candidatus Magnetoovum sp. WYHC-5]
MFKSIYDKLKSILEVKLFRHIVVVAITLLILFPLYNLTYVVPSFHELMEGYVETESLSITKHLAENINAEEESIRINDKFLKDIMDIQDDFNIARLTVYSPNGDVIFSTSDDQTKNKQTKNKQTKNKIDENLLNDVLSKGDIYSKVVHKSHSTVKAHDKVYLDVYVPFISNNKLTGIYEISYDYTEKHVFLEGLILKSNAITMFLSTTMFGIIIFILVKSEKVFNEYAMVYNEIERNHAFQNVISSVLKLSFKNLLLKEYLELALDLLLSLPWLSVNSVGCIFLYDKESHKLVLTVRRNFPKQLLNPCKEVQIGECLCGLAASTRELVYANSIDERHSITYDDMPPHGHYCIPIKSKDKLLGVINLDLKHGHKRSPYEEHFLLTFADTLASIIEHKQTSEQLDFYAHYDVLTGLPNRTLLYDRLEQSLKHSRIDNTKTVVMLIDLDHFKYINDILGHDVGDIMLKIIANNLSQALRDTDTVSRSGGDEFIIITRVDEVEAIEKIAKKLIETICKPIKIKDQQCSVIASIGISLFPVDGEDVHTLLKKADIAMYNAKLGGGKCYLFYASSMDKEFKERNKLENDIRNAIENDELILYYQPQIELSTGNVIGMEALIRWQHPVFGLIPPNKFIPIAETTGIITLIGEWVLDSACRQNKMWQDKGFLSLTVAVNVSSNQFQQYNFVEECLRILSETGLEPKYLELEVTESVSMKNVDTTISILKELNNVGVKISIDDFGTGYSSLSYLKHLPFSKLKIDRAFIRDVTFNNDDLAITKTIIDMGHNLNLKVIAEGVETQEQLELLKKLKCDEVQGFYFSKPVPAVEAE